MGRSIFCAAVVLATFFCAVASAAAPAPVSVKVTGPSRTKEGIDYTWTAVVSNAPANVLLTYSWSFGDKALAGRVNDSSVRHRFTSAGTYSVTVVVQNTLATDTPVRTSSIVVVSVDNSPPVISQILTRISSAKGLVPLQTAVDVAQNVFFDAMASDSSGQELKYVWSFGDCTQNIEGKASVVHQFHFPGVFTVTLQVWDSNGGYAMKYDQVTIACKPEYTNETTDDFRYRNNGNCNLYAKCTKVGPGNYTCLCESGFRGDGFTCERVFNPCDIGGAGYLECIAPTAGSKTCTPESIEDGMYTGGYLCGTDCREGFVYTGGRCEARTNPCDDPRSSGYMRCATLGQSNLCIPETVQIGDGLIEALFTGGVQCGTQCAAGFETVESRSTFGVTRRYCLLIRNPCATGQTGRQNCTNLGFSSCQPEITPASASTPLPLYTGAYQCSNTAGCLPGYTQTASGSCLRVLNPCLDGNPGKAVCSGSGKTCLPRFTLNQNVTTFDGKYDCGTCTAGYVEERISEGSSLQQPGCRPNDSPCKANSGGTSDCKSKGLTCFAILTDSASQLFQGTYECSVGACSSGFTTVTHSVTNELSCVPTQSSDNTAAIVGGVVGGVGGACLLGAVFAIFMFRRRRTQMEKEKAATKDQKEEWEQMDKAMREGVVHPLYDPSVGDRMWSNPFADRTREESAAAAPQPAKPVDPEMEETRRLRAAAPQRTYEEINPTVSMRGMPEVAAMSPEELMQLENPLYIPEREGIFTNPMARGVPGRASKAAPKVALPKGTVRGGPDDTDV
eukprot:Opistho-2@44682